MKEINKKDVVILCGDWNAKIGKTSVEWQDIIGNYGFGERNERGERLLQFAVENDLVVANTLFKHKDVENGHGDHQMANRTI